MTYFREVTKKQAMKTVMVNEREGKRRVVDTTAVPILVMYFYSLTASRRLQFDEVLDVVEHSSRKHMIEKYTMWSFNNFYPCDWESTSLALYVLEKYARIKTSSLRRLGELLEYNTVENGTGVWVRGPYSRNNAERNDFDPVSSINILRLHYLIGTRARIRRKVEDYIERSLSFHTQSPTTLYYTRPVGAFFARRIIEDFPYESRRLAPVFASFIGDTVESVEQGSCQATNFENVLLGLSVRESVNDQGLIFHHARRPFIWYGSPLLYELARKFVD